MKNETYFSVFTLYVDIKYPLINFFDN